MEPDAVPSRRLDARIRNVGGTLLVGGPREVLELTETAAFVWNRIDGDRTIRDLGAALASEYDVPVETATEDVAELVDELVANEVVSIRGS